MRLSPITKIAVLSLVAACESATPAEAPPSAPPAAQAPAEAPPAAAVDEHAAHAAAVPAGELLLAPAGAKVSFVAPVAGAKISGPAVAGKVAVTVTMGAENIAVKPAGAPEVGSGHHHIIVDGQAEPLGAVVPKDDTHLHFGQGQTEASVPLAPGKHTLTLQFADGLHRSYGPALTATIEIQVEAVGGGTAPGAADEPGEDDEEDEAP
jgi:hypothetical protein